MQISDAETGTDVFAPTGSCGGSTKISRIKTSAELSRRTASQYKSAKLDVGRRNEIVKKMDELINLAREIDLKMTYDQPFGLKMTYTHGRLDERSKIEEAMSGGPGRAAVPRFPTFAEAVKVPKIPQVSEGTNP